MINDTYKYWFFYIKPEYLDLVYTEEEDSLLYAYTDNKEYAKMFKEQRDMNKFFVVKREIDKDEVNYLAKDFMREYLIKKEVKTKSRGIGSKTIKYDLILTSTEEHMINHISSKILIVDSMCYAWLNPYIFNNEYLSALAVIGFKEKFDMMNNLDSVINRENKMGTNIQADLLSTFIKEYGFLLASDKKEGED